MKNTLLTALLGVLITCSTSVNAQQDNIVKFIPLGAMIQTSHFGGASAVGGGYSLSAGYERVLGANSSIQANLGGVFGNGAFGLVKLQYRHYLLKNAPHGLHIGGYIPLGFATNAVIVGIGPQVGYQMFFLDNQLAVGADLGLGFGYTVVGSSGAAGVNFGLDIGAGYAF